MILCIIDNDVTMFEVNGLIDTRKKWYYMLKVRLLMNEPLQISNMNDLFAILTTMESLDQFFR